MKLLSNDTRADRATCSAQAPHGARSNASPQPEIMLRRTLRVLVAVLLVLAWQTGSAGAIAAVDSRAALGANDFIDWGQLGPDGTPVATPFAATSDLGWGPHIAANAGGGFVRLEQAASWGGNFAPGDNVLYSTAEGAMFVTFAAAVQGAGVQFQASLLFVPFLAIIDVYGADDILFGTVMREGNSNAQNDDSAIFLGFLSTLEDVTRIRLRVIVGDDKPVEDAFAINRFDLVHTPAIPEPSTWSLLAAGLWVLARCRRTSSGRNHAGKAYASVGSSSRTPTCLRARSVRSGAPGDWPTPRAAI